ncbi:hypothetical protein M2404_004042 [Rheinheimera pacifica]|uniref:hypothetical protein n=1 Tax=Rheinheimera pacifica TaxID=173990 RepID=UPI0021688B45|nr:hypothetical protein [Rheinheimera pacifica]MCS4309665.1 hypothetical protein [Rheinheimera pacifica]
MARRKELKNIAQGIVCSFVSRNNDYDGYWELAKLYDLANKNGDVKVTIDLIQPGINPSSEAFEPLVFMWRNKLLKMLESRAIPVSWVKSAVIHSGFNVAYVAELHKWGTYGEPCTCECEIITDRGDKYSESAGTTCMPFSQAWFQRSTRRKSS